MLTNTKQLTIKNLKSQTPEKFAEIILKVEQLHFFDRVMHPEDADGMANSADCLPRPAHPKT